MAEGVWQEHQRRWFWVYVGFAAVFWGLAWVASWEWSHGALPEDGASRLHIGWHGAVIQLLLAVAIWRGRSWAWFLSMALGLAATILTGWFAVSDYGPSLGLLALSAALQLTALRSMRARDHGPASRRQRPTFWIRQAKEEQ